MHATQGPTANYNESVSSHAGRRNLPIQSSNLSYFSKGVATDTISAANDRKSFDIKDCVAFVTGTNNKNGMGRAFVDALLLGGARKVYATARPNRLSELDELVESYPDGRVVVIALDVTDQDMVRTLGTQCPDVDLVINNAGASFSTNGGNSLVLDPKKARMEMEVNYFGPMRIVQAFASNLTRSERKENGSCAAALVTVASILSFRNVWACGYGSSKAAVHYLTDAHRRDLGGNTLVIGVYPGAIDTDMNSKYEFKKYSPSSVAHELLAALKEGKEHLFPDPYSKKWVNDYLERTNKSLKQLEDV